MKSQQFCGPVLGSLVYQLPGGVTLAYDLHLGCMIARWKGIIEEIHFGGSIKSLWLAIIEVLDPKKTSFRPSKWPRKFRNRKTAKNSKLPEDCFEPVGIGGWPPDIHLDQSSLLRKKWSPLC
jgi:hypothetical protein